MQIEFSKQALKAIGGMDPSMKRRIKKAVEELPAGDVKPLKGVKGSYRIRVGDYRILFSYADKNTLLIEKIAPRGDVYKGV